MGHLIGIPMLGYKLCWGLVGSNTCVFVYDFCFANLHIYFVNFIWDRSFHRRWSKWETTSSAPSLSFNGGSTNGLVVGNWEFRKDMKGNLHGNFPNNAIYFNDVTHSQAPLDLALANALIKQIIPKSLHGSSLVILSKFLETTVGMLKTYQHKWMRMLDNKIALASLSGRHVLLHP